MYPFNHLDFTKVAAQWLQAASLLLITSLAVSPADAETRQYSYDDLRRLISVRYSDGTVITFTYDNVGNRLVERVTLSSTPADSPPNAPSNPSIANGSTGVSTTPSLSWRVPPDPDSGDNVVSYVYFGTSDNPPLVTSGWATNWSPGHLSGFTTYYWYVVARDSRGMQTSSSLWSFTTGNDPPEPDFIASPTSGWAPLKVTFSDRSVSLDDAIVSWAWDFNGDGTIDSTAQNPTWTYTAAGNSPVSLTVTDAHGGTATVVKPAFIHVLDKTVLDLAPVSLALKGTAPYRHIGVIYSVTNLGTQSVTVPCDWEDLFYVSTNTVLDASALQVGYFHESATLLPGSYYTRTNVIALPAKIDSHYNLFLKADGNRRLPEIDENNNVAGVPLNLAAANLAPDTLSPPPQLLSGEKVELAWKVANPGNERALGPWYDSLYISTNSSWDWSAESLGSLSHETNLLSGANYWVTNEVRLPRLSPGTYHLFLKIDETDTVFESEEGDNTLQLAAEVILGPQPDLKPLTISAPTPLLSGQTVQLTWAITNQGTAPALERWYDSVCLATQAVWDVYDGSRQYLAQYYHEMELAPGASYRATNQVYMPRVGPGTYYLLLYTDANDYVFESNEGNNVLATAVAVELGAQPDLVPVKITAPSLLPAGQTVEILTTITNRGVGLAQGQWMDSLYLSTNSTFDGSGFLAFSFQDSSLAAGASLQETNSVQCPRLAPGNYYLYAAADVLDQLFESNETNNILRLPVTVTLPAQPDLVPFKLLSPPTMSPGQISDLVWGITNQGPGQCQGPWQDVVYLSTNSAWDQAATPVSFYTYESNLAAHQSYLVTNTIMIPSVKSGTYYLFLMTDAADQIYEVAEDNNLISAPLTIAGVANGPDLAPIRLDAPSWAQPGSSIQVTYTIKNLASASATGAWMDMLWFSSSSVWDESADSVGLQYVMNPLPGGGSYSQTATVNLPVTDNGTYYLLVQANAYNVLLEADPDNNFMAAPIQIGSQPPVQIQFTGFAYLPNGNFEMAVEGSVGSSYTLLGSTNLTDWQAVLTFNCTNNPTWIEDPGSTGFRQRFYRVTAPTGAAPAK